MPGVRHWGYCWASGLGASSCFLCTELVRRYVWGTQCRFQARLQPLQAVCQVIPLPGVLGFSLGRLGRLVTYHLESGG